MKVLLHVPLSGGVYPPWAPLIAWSVTACPLIVMVLVSCRQFATAGACAVSTPLLHNCVLLVSLHGAWELLVQPCRQRYGFLMCSELTSCSRGGAVFCAFPLCQHVKCRRVLLLRPGCTRLLTSSVLQSLRRCAAPSDNWGPAKFADRSGRYRMDAAHLTETMQTIIGRDNLAFTETAEVVRRCKDKHNVETSLKLRMSE